MVAPPTPREVLAELQKYASNPPTQILEDDDLRRDIYLAAQKLQLRLEDAPSAMQRLTIGHSCESAVLQVAFDLGLFPYLASEGTPKRLDSIKTNIKANEGLLLRVLRFLAASGVVCEVHNDAYTLAPSCHLFGEQSFVTAARDCDEIVSQIFASTPAFLADIGHQNPTNRRNGPTNKAIGLPDADMFEVLKVKYPEKMTSLAHFLGSMTKDSEKPHEIYPVKQRLIQGAEHVPETYIWVDVGGGMGLYTAALKRAYPSLPGKCVVQEQEAMVAVAKSLGADKEVDYMSHDFLTDQPIKGARAYYFRNIFHNWGDKESKVILEKTRNAMREGYSRLLIQDLVMPEHGATQWEATQDWLMLMGYCAHERSEKQWHELLSSAGLSIKQVYQNKGGYPIIEAEISTLKGN